MKKRHTPSRSSASSARPRPTWPQGLRPPGRQKLGVSEETFHRWRNQYGGMKAER